MNKIKQLFGEKNLMLISQVLFWLSISFAIVSPTPELMNILILTFCQAISWSLLIVVMVKEGKVRINKSIADGFVLLLMIILGLSAILSRHPWVSFWGHGTSIGYSFVSFLLLGLSYFYIRLTLHARQSQMLVHSIIISLITLAGWYSFAGQFLKIPLATSVGGSILFSQVFLMVSLVVFLIAALSKQSRLLTIISSIIVLIDLIMLIVINSMPMLLVILLLLLVMMILPISKKLTHQASTLIIIFGIALVVLAAILLPIRIWFQQTPLVAINLPWLMHLPIIKGVLVESALFGFGLGNFSSAFYAFKPLAFNILPFFNIGFTQARTLPLELLATTGSLGFASTVAFACSVMILAWKRLTASNEVYEHNLLYTWLLIIILSLIIAPSFSLLMLIVVIAGMIVNKPQLFESSISLSSISKMLLLYGGILCVITGTYYFIHFKSASLYLFSIDENPEHQLQLIPRTKRAVSLLPNEMEHKVTYANLLMLKNEQISDEDSKIIQELYQKSASTAKSFDDISILASSMNIYVNRTQDTQVPLMEMLTKMMEMDPNNPFYPYQRAISYIQQAQSIYTSDQKVKQYDQILTALNNAQAELLKAIELKENYKDALDLQSQITEVQSQIESEQKLKVK